MPQLDTIYILTIFLWTWLMLYLIVQKIKTFTLTTYPQKGLTHNKPMSKLPWL